jgi:hypothetical protein
MIGRVGRVLTSVVVLACALAAGGCGVLGNKLASVGRTDATTQTTPAPAPAVVLSENEKKLWAPLPADRSRIPVLLYHGIGPASDFKNTVDAQYGISAEDFAKQMTLIKHAGFQTVSLQTFLRFVQGESVDLPPRPLLLIFDDGRADSWINGDGILKNLSLTAVVFVDVGRVAASDPEYLTWKELQTMETSGRWQVQLHAGRYGHTLIRLSSRANDLGPFYAYKKSGESFDDWKNRTFSDIEGGDKELATHISQYKPLAFALPFGAYGQDSTNDPRIPDTLLTWLTQRYPLVFASTRSWFAKPGSPQPLGRFEVKRVTSVGDLHNALAEDVP